MVQAEWRSYTNSLYASKWYTLFPDNDGRHSLTWTGRFASVVGPQLYNFYSSGEDVLDNLTVGGLTPQDIGDALHGRYAWCFQELWKGRYMDWMGGSRYGGWGFISSAQSTSYYNRYYDYNRGRYVFELWSPAQAATIPLEALKSVPLFNFAPPIPTLCQEPNNPSGTGSLFASTNRNRLLAQMIPALSFAAGANPVPTLDMPLENHNINMQGQFAEGGFQNNWPSERYDPVRGNCVLHGDYHVVAYTYLYKVFDRIKVIGSLNQ